MPWHKIRIGNRFCVAKEGENTPIPGGCHASEGEADKHIAALYADEPKARAAASMGDASEPFPVPVYIPDEWLERPTWLAADTPGLTITDEGQAAAYFYQRGACLVHDPSACPQPSPTGYAMFHQQRAITASGEEVLVGVIGNNHGHANPLGTIADASAHYSDPTTQLMLGRVGDDEHGGWFAGAIVPGLTHAEVAMLRRCALSGDWRPMPPDWWARNGVSASQAAAADGYDSLGPTLVNRPGLPIVRRFMAADAMGDALPVLLGGMGGVQLEGGCEGCADTSPDQATSTTQEDTVGDQQLQDRITALEDERRQREDAERDARRARVAAVAPPEVPAPLGFGERTIHLTDADRDHIARQAAPMTTSKPSPKSAPDRPQAQRKEDAKEGLSLPDGSYRIATCGDAKNARLSIGRANPGDRDKVRAHIAKREKALGCDNGPPPGD